MLSVVADSASQCQTLVYNGQITLEHWLAHVLSYPVRVEGVDGIVIESVLQVEEADRRENIDNHHGEKSRAQQLVRIQRHSLNNIGQRWEPHDYIQKLQTVEQLIWQKAKHTDAKVQDVVLKASILQEKVQVYQPILVSGKEIAEIDCVFVEIEFDWVWTVDHKQNVSLLDAHFINI